MQDSVAPCARASGLGRLLSVGSSSSARFTITKFADCAQYMHSTSHWRHALVILVTPLPSLVLALLGPLVPLQDPRLGLRANATFVASFFVTFTVVLVGSIVQLRASSGIAHQDFSHRDVLAVAVVDGLLSTATVTAGAALWRFPVPFMVAMLFVPLLLCFVTAHVVVLRGRLLRRDSVVRGPLLSFLLPFAVQASQVVAYPALSAVFAASTDTGQVALVVLFPFIKVGFRAVLRRLTRHLPDDGNESAVSGVEIAAVMYQSLLMQSVPSVYATTLLVAIDIVQTFVTIFVFMAKPPRTIVRQATQPIASSDKVSTARSALVVVSASTSTRVHPLSSAPLPADEHTLQLLYTAESLVLIEYFEVVLPAVNAVFLVVASQLDSAEKSPKLRLYRHRPAELDQALESLLIYTGLQTLSFVVMHVIVWRRYGVSTITLLAYLLERHAWALQGKLIAWLSLMFQLPVIHYGFDFTFQFDWRLPPLP